MSEDGAATIMDAHGNQFGQVKRDEHQDYQLIVGYQYQDTTIIRFKRKLETCDREDLSISVSTERHTSLFFSFQHLILPFQNDTFKVVWSHSESDPPEYGDLGEDNKNVDLFEKLPPMTRSGSRSLHLYESSSPHKYSTLRDALKWKVQSNSVLLPARDTLYWCTMLRLPELPGKHHLVGYHPTITPGNEPYVHHMMLYECHDDDIGSYESFDHHVNSGYECNAPNMPREFKKCKGIVAGWGVGGEPFYFPDEAGYPMGEDHGGSTYYMFEVHYDNPGLIENIVDSSGLEMLLTPKLRKYDSGMLTVGHDVSSLHLIPPGMDNFLTIAHCPDLCTQVTLLPITRMFMTTTSVITDLTR